MTGSRFLIDTNIVIALFAGEAGVQNRIAAAPEVFVPSTVVGELHYGAHKSGRVAENVRRVEEFTAFIVCSRVMRGPQPCTAKSRRHSTSRVSPSPKTTSGSPPSPGSTG